MRPAPGGVDLSGRREPAETPVQRPRGRRVVGNVPSAGSAAASHAPNRRRREIGKVIWGRSRAAGSPLTAPRASTVTTGTGARRGPAAPRKWVSAQLYAEQHGRYLVSPSGPVNWQQVLMSSAGPAGSVCPSDRGGREPPRLSTAQLYEGPLPPGLASQKAGASCRSAGGCSLR